MGNGEPARNRAAITAGCILLLLFSAAVVACLGTPPVSPMENATPVASVHPRLYFTAGDLPGIREKIQREPYRSLWESVQHRAAETPMPPGTAPTQRDLEQATIALRTNAFVYAVSGDPQAGERARRYLLQVSGWSHWQSRDRVQTGKLVNYGSGPLHGAIGETYDWIYPLLNTSERQVVVIAMVNRSLEPARLQYGTPDETADACTNRISLAYGGVGVIAFALRGDLPENPGVEPYSGLVHDVMTRKYFDCFDRDGGWSEGIGYLSFGLSEDAGGSGGIYYAEALRRATGEDLFRLENFRHAPDFLLYFLPPDRKGESSAFGDEDFSSAFRSPSAAALASRTANPYAQWYYQNAPLEQTDPIGEILFADDSLPATSPEGLYPTKRFRDLGWVAMRTGWGLSDTLAGFICGPRGAGHDRPERNSFMLDALGERLVITPGLTSLGYEDPDYPDYHAATVGQNTILVNGNPRSQPRNDPGTSCTITGFFTSPYYDQVQGEAAAAYGGRLSRFTRDLIFVKPEEPGFLVVRDDLATATGAATFDFLLHALGSDSISLVDPEGGRATITRGNATLHVAVILPRGASLSVLPGSPTHFEGSDQPTSYLQAATGPVPEARFLVVLYPVITGSAVPEVAEVREGDVTGVTVTRGKTTDLLLFAPSGAGISAAGVVSDGRMAWIRLEEGVPAYYALREGTSLAYRGRVLSHSPTPTSGADRVPAT